MTASYLALKYLGGFRRLFNLTTSLSVIGMTIAVASLVVAMAVFSGYISTLEKTVQDAIGHLLVVKRGSADQQSMLQEIEPVVPGLVAKTPFVYAEAILAHKGQISGIMIEGVDEESVHEVLNLKARISQGEMDLSQISEEPAALIGKGIAQKFNLKPGDTFRIVLPMVSEFNPSDFRPKIGKFTVAGIIHYGRYDYDSRHVIVSLPVLQEFAQTGKRITGFRLRMQNPAQAGQAAIEITNRFGNEYWVRDWREGHRNLFEAAALEKAVLFCVLMILVVAAAFNIANTLFISVVQRYRDISVLKTLGAPDPLIRRIFTVQGLVVGAIGAIAGITVGLALCQFLEWLQTVYDIVPAEVYKLDHIDLDVRVWDLVMILAASLLVCFVATLVPSWRGSKISPVEGLRYE